MATNNKKLIWIGIASAVIIGGGAFLWWRNKQSKEEEKRKQEAEEKERQEQEKATQGSVSPPRTIQLPSTPFNSKAEGDKFRAWVNKNYPTYAKQNDLSLSGDYNNSFIRKAFQQYGVEYIKDSKTATKSTASGYKSGSLIYLKEENSSIYSFPDFKGDYIIGSVDKTLTLDRPFAKYISNTGKGFLKVETIAFNPKCPPNSRCMPVFQAMKKIAYVPEKFVSNKPY